MQSKASEFTETLGLAEFRGSNGWLDSWKSSYNISCFKVSGESSGVSADVFADYRQRLPAIIQGYELSDVFNCDETGLFFRVLPDKTLAVKGSDCKGGKLSKERLTVMFCCSATGEKLKPLVIGKSRKPHCFRNVNVQTLPVTWWYNKKAWMTGDFFTEWVKGINSLMKRQKRKILLFLDNATSHSHDLEFSNVKLKFLPANTTSVLQPLDQGIIWAFKARYRKKFLKHLISRIDQCEHASTLAKAVTVLDAVYWIHSAWQETTPQTIMNCYRHAGFPNESQIVVVADDPEDDLPLAELARQLPSISTMPKEDYLALENDLLTETTYTDEWEQTLISEFKNNKTPQEDDSDSDHNDETDSRSSKCDLTHVNILEMLDKIKNFALVHDDRNLAFTEEMKTMTEDTIMRQRLTMKQTTLDSFLI